MSVTHFLSRLVSHTLDAQSQSPHPGQMRCFAGDGNLGCSKNMHPKQSTQRNVGYVSQF